jgi:hypothetical protein
VASQNGTVITQSGGAVQSAIGAASLNLNAGQFVELEATLASGGCYISANKPVGVCSYLMGSGGAPLLEYNGDPAMMWVPPIEQTVNGALLAPFVPAAGSGSWLSEHYVLLVAAAATCNQTLVSVGTGTPTTLTGTWTAGSGAEGSAYSFYSFHLTETDSSYYFFNPHGLIATGYGIGGSESYAYMAGSSSRSLDAAFYINDTHYQDMDGQLLCDPASTTPTVTFKSAIQYALSTVPGYLKWYINGVEETSAEDASQWNKTLTQGTFTVEMEVLDMNNLPHRVSSTFTVSSCLVPVNPHLRTLVTGN